MMTIDERAESGALRKLAIPVTRVPSLVNDCVRPKIASRNPKMVIVLTSAFNRRGVSTKIEVAAK